MYGSRVASSVLQICAKVYLSVSDYIYIPPHISKSEDREAHTKLWTKTSTEIRCIINTYMWLFTGDTMHFVQSFVYSMNFFIKSIEYDLLGTHNQDSVKLVPIQHSS